MLKRIINLFCPKKKKEIFTTSDINEKINNLFDSLDENIIKIHIGTDLNSYRQLIYDTVFDIRVELQDECGFIIPTVNIEDNFFIQENELVIYIREKKIVNCFMIPNQISIQEEFYELFKSTVYEYIKTIFTNELTEKYIYAVQKNNNLLVWNLTNILSTIDIKTILTDIILQGKSISNINYIFEKIGEQVLSSGEYRDYLKKYNPHAIAREIITSL